MKRLIAVVLLLVLCVVGFGFYRGWFTLSRDNRGTPGDKIDINLTVDRQKVNQDAESVKERTMELTGQTTDESREAGDQASDSVKSAEE